MLAELAIKHKTDKVQWGYIDHYERYFPEITRYFDLKILEIGVKRGASLRMWQDYFYKAKIYGMDINSNCAHPTGTTIFIGDQSKKEDLQAFKKKHGLGFDFIVDDGGHSTRQQITSFKCLWEAVEPRGLYVIEDLVTQYAKHKLTKPEHLDIPNITTMDFLYGLIDNINNEGVATDIDRMEFTKWQCFITKKG